MSVGNVIWRPAAAALLCVLALAMLTGSGQAAATRQDATPAVASCDTATPMAGMAMGTPMAGMDHGGMAMGTPGAETTVEFDQLYIDMMLPHHDSIVAMAHVALQELQDERLREIAQTIIDTQSAEQAELRGHREQFYGSPEPAPMDAQMMATMMEAMPGMGSMDAMMAQMDATTFVAQFCAAADPELAFIDLTIPHHEMAITASEAALTQAVHPEIRDFAQRVITAQQAEIEELTAIRAELEGGTPAS